MASVRFADWPAKAMTARGAPGTEGTGSAGRLAATAGPDGAASDCTGGVAKIGPEIGALVDGPDDSVAGGAAAAAAGGSLRASRGGRRLASGTDRRRLSIGPGGGGRRLALRAAASGDPGTSTRAG